MDVLEIEERDLQERLERGEITNAEYDREWNDILRDYRGQAEEAAQRAYDEEMERW